MPLAPNTSSPAVAAGLRRLAVAALGGPAGHRVGIAGRVDPAGSERTRTSGATEPTVGSAKGARPASIQPAVTSVSLFRSWMNSPRAASIPAFAAAQKPPFGSSRTYRHVRAGRAASHSAVPSSDASSATMTSIG